MHLNKFPYFLNAVDGCPVCIACDYLENLRLE